VGRTPGCRELRREIYEVVRGNTQFVVQAVPRTFKETYDDMSAQSFDGFDHWHVVAVAGRDLSGPARVVRDEDAAVRRLVELLADAGFEPEGPALPGGPIRLRRCPFEPLARDHRSVVCGVHLGLMRGALRQMGAPLDAAALEPYVEPDLCLAHLTRN
jgi:hypothetical protein